MLHARLDVVMIFVAKSGQGISMHWITLNHETVILFIPACQTSITSTNTSTTPL
jgi:hypothetical protein